MIYCDTLYLVFWDNGNFVGGFTYDLKTNQYQQVFNTSNNLLCYSIEIHKCHNCIILTESEWRTKTGRPTLREYLSLAEPTKN